MIEIKHYAVRVYGGDPPNGLLAQIHLFSQQNKMVGGIDFYANELPRTDFPPDSQDPFIKMAMHQDRLTTIVDLLRNEKPIYLAWQKHLGHAYLGTMQERVGEGEEKITIQE